MSQTGHTAVNRATVTCPVTSGPTRPYGNHRKAEER
jgi:hypothetical protein